MTRLQASKKGYKTLQASKKGYKTLQSMNSTTVRTMIPGPPCDPEEGTSAARVERTVMRPEAYSINQDDSSGDGLTEGLDPSTRNEPFINDIIQSEEPTSAATDKMRLLNNKREEIISVLGRKQGINIASMNIRGRKNEQRKEKWAEITTIMRKNKIAVLAVQETHLNETEAEKLGDKYQNIIVESNGTETNKEGVAFILNKELVQNKVWKHETIIPGRVSRLQIEWDNNQGLDIINVYAPNRNDHKVEFFEKLDIELRGCQGLENPIVMGDFNFVEKDIDRYPNRCDDNVVTEAFEKIKKKWSLIDGWREQFPNRKDYTFMSGVAASRIDRIYVNEEIFPYAYVWGIKNPTLLSDHQMVVTGILKKDLPYIGDGFWRLDNKLLDDVPFMNKINKILLNAEQEMNNPELCPQLTWYKTKDIIKKTAIDRRKQKQQEVSKTMSTLRKNLREHKKDLYERNSPLRSTMKSIKEARDKLAKAQTKETEDIQKRTRTKYWRMGEKNTKYWFNLKKSKTQNNIMIALRDKDNKLTRTTKDMLDIAVHHHEDLQKEQEMTQNRKEAIDTMKSSIDTQLTDEHKKMLKEGVTKRCIRAAIKKAKNGSSPGNDGITYELYKAFSTPTDKYKANVTKILTTVWKDVEKNGIRKKEDADDNSSLTDCIMTLLYKKKEKDNVENYRPITLLNTDYKIYTMTIAAKLGLVATEVIHPDQAGFIPGRNLYDHTNTTHLAIEYCELTETNGCIVALDQEKAYDKIDHEYMWNILEAFGFPSEFINRIKTLYKDIDKKIIINGVISRAFKIKRGVHQGDPMSCLLYDFSIEPLAISIRKRAQLKGIKLPTETEKLIVALFADDTLVYLNEKDKFKDLEEIIDLFCLASTARFNQEKTEYLPVGTKEFRMKVEETREICGKRLNDQDNLIRDGQALRTLGAWVGNNIETKTLWKNITDQQEKILSLWKNAHLSMRGKELILKALIQSRAIFLATVNGMPKDIEEKMNKMYREFVWEGKRGSLAWEKIIAPRQYGGLDMPDIRTRIEAIQVMWLKKWLSPDTAKPKWTCLMNEIIHRNIAKNPKVEKKAIESWILQSWHESESKDAKISRGIRDMLKTARKYNIEMDAPKLSKETKRELPIWHNIGVENNYAWNKKAAKCLRNNHDIKTIGDLDDYDIGEGYDCQTEACRKMGKTLIKNLPDIANPKLETPKKTRERNLDHTPRRIKNNSEQTNKVLFNPDVTAKGNPHNHIRVFNEARGTKTRKHFKQPRQPAYRKTLEDRNEESVTVWTVAKAERQGCENSKVTIALHYEEQDPRNKIIVLENKAMNAVEAQIKAITLAAKETASSLKIMTMLKNGVPMLKLGFEQKENNDWLEEENADAWIELLQTLRDRDGETTIEYIAKDDENYKIVEQIRKNMRLPSEDEDHPPGEEQIPETNYMTKGARLSTITQKIAYKLAIKRNMTNPMDEKTKDRFAEIRKQIREQSGLEPTDEMIWKSIAKIEPARISDFIWKIAHNRLKCGGFFRHVKGWEERQFCKCEKIENIDHIMYCEENHAEAVWKSLEEIWYLVTNETYNRPSIEETIGIGTIRIKQKNTYNKDLTQLYQRLTLLAVWTIWKMRNKRVIQEKEISRKETLEEYERQIKEKIEIEYDWAICQKNPKKKKSLLKQLKKVWCKEGVLAEIIKTRENNQKKIELKVYTEDII